jgi:hypothetical protein
MLAVLLMLGSAGQGRAGEPFLALAQSGATHRFTASELLAREGPGPFYLV